MHGRESTDSRVFKSFENENREAYGLDGNSANLTFEQGVMVSRGTLNDINITIDLRYCKGCGICTEECPTASLWLVQETGSLREAIQSFEADPAVRTHGFDPHRPLTWQELPHHGGLIVSNGHDSNNFTGEWRVDEVVVADANRCVLRGLCYQYCPEDIIAINTGAEV